MISAPPPEKLDIELESLLVNLRNKSRAGLGWIKRTANKGVDLTLHEGVKLEIDAFLDYSATSTHPSEGIRSFRERRQPEF